MCLIEKLLLKRRENQGDSDTGSGGAWVVVGTADGAPVRSKGILQNW